MGQASDKERERRKARKERRKERRELQKSGVLDKPKKVVASGSSKRWWWFAAKTNCAETPEERKNRLTHPSTADATAIRLREVAFPTHPMAVLGALRELRANPPQKRHVPQLIAILEKANYLSHLQMDLHDPRAFAASWLGNLGKAANAGVDALVNLLDEDDEDVRECAAEALERIGNHSARSALQERLHDSSFKVRLAVIGALRMLAADPVIFLDSLREVLHADDFYLRERALNLVAQVGKPAVGLIDEVRSLLEDEHTSVRDSAVAACRAIERKTGILGIVDRMFPAKLA